MGTVSCRKHVLGSLALLLVGAAARAQDPGETPVDLGSLDAGAAPAIVSGLGDDPSRRLVLGGFGVASFGWNADTGESSFDASALALSAYKAVSDHLSVFVQLTAARESASPFLA